MSVLSVERDNVIPAVERPKERNLQRCAAWVTGKIGFSFTLLPSVPVRIPAFIDDSKATVIALAISRRDLLQSAFKAMIKAGNFVPGSEIAFGIEVIHHGNALWRGWGTTGDHQKRSGYSGNDGEQAHSFILRVFFPKCRTWRGK
ncbi:hypothetical protein SDC9_183759 [bioreactor metagenome]|uniref:Uncharacterized protein n=1 Tax=bioreactor metagenome TaxID=1076179 RepID=A0A645HC12_9ZZZZ